MKPLSVRTRTIDQLVEEQINKAAIRSRSRTVAEQVRAPMPVIAISREPCAGGTTLGRRVADRLGFACWDQELLTRIAEQSGAVESILASVDERVHSPVMEFVRSLLVGFEYTQDEYRLVLTKVVGAIAHQGAAVVVGRGAHLILGPIRSLRVRVVCATEERITRLMQRDGLGRATAARRIKELGVDIAAFMRHHYQQDAADPHNFDIVVNSGTLTIEAASDLIIAAYRTRFGHLFETQPVVPVAAERTESSRVDLKIA
jgi:cytidylate kinase